MGAAIDELTRLEREYMSLEAWIVADGVEPFPAVVGDEGIKHLLVAYSAKEIMIWIRVQPQSPSFLTEPGCIFHTQAEIP